MGDWTPDRRATQKRGDVASCGEANAYEELVEAAANACYFSEQYLAMTDGGDPPLETCFECGRDTYLVADQVCAACGTTLWYTECTLCGEPLGPDEQDLEGLCGYHHHMSDKDDRL